MKHTMIFRGLVLILAFVVVLPAHAQMNQLKKAAKKALKQSVQPLEFDFEVTKVKYDPMKSPDKIGMTMVFKGHNPNDLGLRLNRTEFDLYIDGKFAAKIYNDKKIEIPKNGDFTFTEKAKVKPTTVGKTLLKKMKDKQVKYRIDATYYVKTPLGEYSFTAEIVEKKL